MHWLRAIAAAGIVFGALLTALGLLAPWWPALDIVNNGIPYLVAGGFILLGLAALTRKLWLIAGAIVILALNAYVLLSALHGSAAVAPKGSDRFLRVVTFNLWGGNDRMQDVTKFLADSDADVVVLQEVTPSHRAVLRQSLQAIYPYTAGDIRLVILSKHPIFAEGQFDRPGFPPWMSLLLRWVRLEVNGRTFELAGVHFARPFYPELQEADVEALIGYAASRDWPLIVAGDFNMSPWTEKLRRIIRTAGIRRYNTFHLTWPLRRGRLPLLPLVAIDNVLASPSFDKITTIGGPSLGSDHRPVVVDLALSEPPGSSR
jgi:endonuclease/exonuclease/phosphatase (EEP) superfamily protein YafD